MAQVVVCQIASLFSNLLALFYLQCIVSKSNGFSLKLIHRDSPQSPLYLGKLTPLERFQRDFKISNYRATYLQLQRNIRTENSTVLPNIIRPLLNQSYIHYTVDISLGTPSKRRTFIFDTGACLVWTQCTPCIKCFKQNYPLFDPRKSSSFKKLPPNNTLSRWFKCNIEGCSYYIEYMSKESSAGYASIETFSFQLSTRVLEKIRNIVFGCGIDNRGTFTPDNAITGTVGMDRSPISLVRQLGNRTMYRFSYCLPSFYSLTKTSFLRFGKDIIIKERNVQTTPFVKLPQDTSYILNLLDISVAGRRLLFKQGTFLRGCIIDTGAPTSVIEQPAYGVVLNEFRKHFSQFRNLTLQHPNGLCYRFPRGFTNFPSMTFHFQGANLEIEREKLFVVYRNFFCLGIMGHPNVTILGAHQQHNLRVIYDLGNEKLSFFKEDCSKDKA